MSCFITLNSLAKMISNLKISSIHNLKMFTKFNSTLVQVQQLVGVCV